MGGRVYSSTIGAARAISAPGSAWRGSWDAVADRALALTGLGTDPIHALQQCLRTVRAGGTVSISGVCGGFLNIVPLMKKDDGCIRVVMKPHG